MTGGELSHPGGRVVVCDWGESGGPGGRGGGGCDWGESGGL